MACRLLCCLCLLALAASRATAGEESIQTDVCVVGGGSAGIGAAVAAARTGAEVALVERQPRLGGTSTQAYVCNWEPGPGGPLAREIYDRLRKRPHAVGITSDHNPSRSKGPFGLWLINPDATYEQTLRRSGRPRRDWRAVVFEPDALSQVALKMLKETGRCRLLLRTTFLRARGEDGRVASIYAEDEDGSAYRICAKVFIDCSGGAHLCRAAGCETMLGPEPRDRFGESMAPENPGKTLNAISLCYRIRKAEDPQRQPPPDPPVKHWPHSAHVSAVPGGDLIVNPLPLVPGRVLIEKGYDATMERAQRAAQAHWRWLQGIPTFAGHELHSTAPMLGIRESYRVLGEYVLTQNDVLGGLSRQQHDDIIAIADHALDVHGAGHRRVHGQPKAPYGVPYRCLIPKGWRNLLVAGRCASFSHVAASSCRLSRTMMALGRAAGRAAAQATRHDLPVAKVDVPAIQKAMARPAQSW